ncbi:hypothetical protein P3342_007021 [Pyrenophora teres f. teres]|nr:hypothetical protein P3342_007021 [Pyrenophora teres f. teres]
MAANDYFNPSGPPQHNNNNNAPLPPTPGNHPQQSISPVSSPFDDRPYPVQTHSSGALGGYPIDTSYSNTSYQQPTQYDSTAHINDPYARQPDPFADQNAIPLQNQQNQHKNDGDAPMRFNNDPEYYGMGVQPARKKSKKKKGWLSGRVTWVVYILTAVQVGVFIGELVKNGTSDKGKVKSGADNIYRLTNRITHPNQTNLQHHDRALTLRPDQHGRPLHALHAQHQK